MPIQTKIEGTQLSIECARDYYITGSLRRAHILSTLGCFLLTLVASFVTGYYEKTVPAARILIASVFFFYGLGASQYLLARFRVNQSGISCRILWWWDLWPWEAFASGQVKHVPRRSSKVYLFPERPWYRNELRIKSLDEDDADQIDALIHQFLPPTPVVLPESVTFKFPLGDQGGIKAIEISDQGIKVQRRKATREYTWSEVTHVQFWRRKSGEAGYLRLTIKVACEEVHLGPGNSTFLNPKDEYASDFVLKHVDGRKVDDFAFRGPSGSLEELEERARQCQRRLASNRIGKWFSVAIFIGGFVFLFLPPPMPDPELKIARVILCFTFSIGSYFAVRTQEKKDKTQLLDYETERDKFMQQREAK